MHPGMIAWWQHRRAAACGEAAEYGCGRGGHHHHRGESHEGHGWQGHWAAHGGDDADFGGGAAFGVRRPLRFLAHKLDLSEEQVAELAKVLNELKTERAQAAVDDRRATSAFADALSGEAFDQAKVSAAADGRVKVAERLRDAVTAALGRIHALLDPQQRAKLAYLIRTGALSI